jgi:hypothetical protein
VNFPAVLHLFEQFALGEICRCFETVGLAVSKFEAMAPAVSDCEASSISIARLLGSAIA